MCLPEGLTSEPGKITLAPYMVEIADAIGDPAVRGSCGVISFRTRDGAQIGKLRRRPHRGGAAKSRKV
jgi:hypothetical protein